MERELVNLIIINAVTIIYWIITLIYREYNKKDITFLRNNVIGICDGWCVSHFIHYVILGYFASTYWPYIIVLGIIFEFIEMALSKVNNYVDSQIIKDPITNTLGLFIGILLFKLFPHEIDLSKPF